MPRILATNKWVPGMLVTVPGSPRPFRHSRYPVEAEEAIANYLVALGYAKLVGSPADKPEPVGAVVGGESAVAETVAPLELPEESLGEKESDSVVLVADVQETDAVEPDSDWKERFATFVSEAKAADLRRLRRIGGSRLVPLQGKPGLTWAEIESQLTPSQIEWVKSFMSKPEQDLPEED